MVVLFLSDTLLKKDEVFKVYLGHVFPSKPIQVDYLPEKDFSPLDLMKYYDELINSIREQDDYYYEIVIYTFSYYALKPFLKADIPTKVYIYLYLDGGIFLKKILKKQLIALVYRFPNEFLLHLREI